MNLEALNKELAYEKVDPSNEEQIKDASFQEKDAFETSLDPQELPSILRYLATKGDVWLQYCLEAGQKIATGVIEFIQLHRIITLKPADVNGKGLSISPLVIAMKNQERLFKPFRRIADDKNIVYYHGIAMSRRESWPARVLPT